MTCIMSLIALIGALGILSMSLQPVTAASTGTATAQVTVSETIDISVSYSGGSAITFGSLNSGTSNNPATNYLNIAIQSDTNVQTDINQSASGDFSGGGHTLGLSNLTYFSSNNQASAIPMTTSYTDSVLSAWQNISPGGSVTANYWLTIPNAQYPTTYSTTINIRAVRH